MSKPPIAFIKKIIPGKHSKLADNLDQLFAIFYDRWRFLRSYSKNKPDSNQHQIETQLTFHAHALEKGLSHQSIRLGFGLKALRGLSNALQLYQSLNFPPSRSYLNALSVLKEYINLHATSDYDLGYLDEIFSKDMLKLAMEEDSDLGGIVWVHAKDKLDNKNKNFEQLFLGRASVREYSDKIPNLATIKQAIGLAMKSPSVCNRQSFGVRIISNPQILESVLKEHGGIQGYSNPPYLLAITTNNNSFVQVFERNQGYIDGGLFSMSLMLALEYYGLATCSLNAMFPYRKEKVIRRFLDIPPEENIIMFIATGSFPEKSAAPKSFRLDPSDITAVID